MLTTRFISGASIAFILLTNTKAFAAEPVRVAVVPEISRAEFVRLIVSELYTDEAMDGCFAELSPSMYRLLFIDVSVNEHYARHLCMAMLDGLVKGYSDGYFRPNRTINFAEASKILTRAYALSPAAGHSISNPWFKGYVDTLASRGAIPMNITRFDQPLTYTLAEEIIRRIVDDVTYLDSKTYEGIANSVH